MNRKLQLHSHSSPNITDIQSKINSIPLTPFLPMLQQVLKQDLHTIHHTRTGIFHENNSKSHSLTLRPQISPLSLNSSKIASLATYSENTISSVYYTPFLNNLTYPSTLGVLEETLPLTSKMHQRSSFLFGSFGLGKPYS